jgi:BCD family chlorophyll transporter-like MFS transporter
MMDMSPFGRAGTFLGFWTLVVTFSRGLGVSGGGIVRDIALQLTGSLPQSYGAVFLLGVIGLLASLWALSRVNVTAFKSAYADQQPADTATVLAGAMD